LLDSTVMKHLIATVVVAAVTSGTAFAQPALTPASTPAGTNAEALPAAPAVTESEWYGWQILLADGATFGMAAVTEQGEIALGWIGTGAVVHAAHGNYGRSVASVGLRVGLPLLGASAGAASASGCTGDFCGLGDVLVGGLVGMGAAEVIDLVMANDEHDIAPPRKSQSWTPVASVRHSGATFGIAARF
jgi:hypothetical protein